MLAVVAIFFCLSAFFFPYVNGEACILGSCTPNCDDGYTYCDPSIGDQCKPGGGGVGGECDQVVTEWVIIFPASSTETEITGTVTETTSTYTDTSTVYEDSEFSVTDTVTITQVCASSTNLHRRSTPGKTTLSEPWKDV